MDYSGSGADGKRCCDMLNYSIFFIVVMILQNDHKKAIHKNASTYLSYS